MGKGHSNHVVHPILQVRKAGSERQEVMWTQGFSTIRTVLRETAATLQMPTAAPYSPQHSSHSENNGPVNTVLGHGVPSFTDLTLGVIAYGPREVSNLKQCCLNRQKNNPRGNSLLSCISQRIMMKGFKFIILAYVCSSP